jgi:5,5'-dehydrodivanillate O-demethylase
MENSVDPSHLFWLHGDTAHLKPSMDHYEEEHEFNLFDYGIMKRRTSAGDAGARVDQHPLLFPNILRHVFKARSTGKMMHNLQYRVPIDDVSTQVFMVTFTPDESKRAAENTKFSYVSMRHDDGSYKMDLVLAQDVMAWETQGAIADRTKEYLGEADRGVVALRRLMRQQIDAVKQGKPPLGVKPADGGEGIIELDVINERIGLARSQTEVAA